MALSFYSADLVKTRQIEPVFDRQNFRSEFRIPTNSAFHTNWRLLNVGVIQSTQGQTALYNSLAGVYGTIKTIELFDGNQTLDSLNHANIWSAFTQYQKSNDYNSNMGRSLVAHSQGYKLDGLNKLDDGTYSSTEFKKVKPFLEVKGTTDTESTTHKAWLSLPDLLPLLKENRFISSMAFKDLRLVVTWETDSTNVINKNNQTFTTLPPLLVVDEVADPASAMKTHRELVKKGMDFMAIESDRVFVPEATSAGAQQAETFVVRGFNNKNVGRMLIVNTPTDSTTFIETNAVKGGGGLMSQNLFKQEMNLRINGVLLYPKPISKSNQRLALLTDTWGVCNTAPCVANNGLYDDTMHLTDTSIVGRQDYSGFTLNRAINTLELDFKRTNIDSVNRYNQALHLNLFAEVPKKIVFTGQGGKQYRIIYQ